MPLPSGSSLGPYVVRERLGAGGMGEVYRAEDPRLGREVAIKVLPAGRADTPAARGRFEREARAVAALQHPNIVTIHDFGVEAGVCYSVSELLEGEPLSVRIARGPLDWREAVRIAAEVCEGLHAAHSRGIVHRDLKPSNLFLLADGRVKVLDFGIALVQGRATLEASERTLPGLIMGSLGYMAPEQVTGERVDRRADLFAVGCVLHEMLTGERAFGGASAAESMAIVLRDTPPAVDEFRPELPFELARLVDRCLAKDPGERVQSALDLASALRNLGEETRPTQPSTQRLRAVPGRPASGEAVRSLAVLPMSNASSDADAEYLSDGVTETLIRNLSQLPNLRVMARSTVFRFKGQGHDPLAAGRELGVEAVVVGRLQERAGRLIVSVELVESQSGACLWSEQYNRPMGDIFALEEDIASRISERLRVRLSGEEQGLLRRRATEDTEAYRLYLRGRFLWNKRSAEGLTRAREYFEQAIEQDPAYALAWAGLADTWNVLPFWGLAGPRDSFPRAQAAAERALELDAGLAEAHAALAYSRFYFDWDWPAAQAGFRRALELKPNYPTGHHGYGVVLGLYGEGPPAVAELRRAQDLDPLSLIIQADLGLVLHLNGESEAAMRQCAGALAFDPHFTPAHLYLGLAQEQVGDIDGALESFARAGARAGGSTAALTAAGHALAVSGRPDEARRRLAELEEMARRRYVSEYAVAVIHAGLGEDDAALDWLRRGLESRCQTMVWMRRDPRLERLRPDPRFAGVVAALGPRVET